MKSMRALSLAGFFGLAGLTGCFSTVRTVEKVQAPDQYKSADVNTLEKLISRRDAAVRTLNASVLIKASTGGEKTGKVKTYTSFKGYIFVRQPSDLRVILQLPVFGTEALDMVSDANKFTLMTASTHGTRWRQGTNEVTKPSKNGLENIRPAVFLDSLLVPGVTKDEYVTLTESTRILRPQQKHQEAVEEPDYDLAVAKIKSGNMLQLERVVHISRVNLLPFQQDIYDAEGQVVTQATYDNYVQSGDEQFPKRITIRRPLDEYSLTIDVTKLALNESFEADQFVLAVPAGAKIERID